MTVNTLDRNPNSIVMVAGCHVDNKANVIHVSVEIVLSPRYPIWFSSVIRYAIRRTCTVASLVIDDYGCHRDIVSMK